MQPGEKGIDVVRLVSADLVDGELAYWLILLPPTPPRVPPPQVVVAGDPLSFTTIREFGGTSIKTGVSPEK